MADASGGVAGDQAGGGGDGAGRPIPRWLAIVASVLIVGHLTAILAMALGASSGPWPAEDGFGWATPPHFTQPILARIEPYLRATKFTNNYHFSENDVTNMQGSGSLARFDVKLRDKEGKELTTLHFPDPGALPAVRHRQSILAACLNADEPVEPRPGEYVPAPDQPVRSVRIWEIGANGVGRVGTIQEHLIPRDRPVFAPSDWAMIAARSYSRYLCRAYGAASAEIIRFSRPFIPPDILFESSPPPDGAFDGSTMSFGVINAPAESNSN